MTSGRVFNESVFNSHTNLQNFFLQSDAINQVLSRKDKPVSKVLYPLNPNLQGKWQICQIATAPFRGILAIVLHIVAKTASLLGAMKFAKQAKTCSQYQWAGFALYSETPTKLFKIKDTVNHPNTQGEIVNRTPNIPISRITDPKVKGKTFHTILPVIRFKHNKGICRGICQWFLYLYLHTKDQFSDPRGHMIALGKQFADGGGMEATLLQSLNIRKGKLLNMKIGTQAAHTSQRYDAPLYTHIRSEWKSSTAQIVHELHNLPAGAYSVALPFHATAYVKINDKLGYFFDPNRGITEINGDAVGEKLYEVISDTLKYIEDATKGESIFFPRIQITPLTLRS